MCGGGEVGMFGDIGWESKLSHGKLGIQDCWNREMVDVCHMGAGWFEAR